MDLTAEEEDYIALVVESMVTLGESGNSPGSQNSYRITRKGKKVKSPKIFSSISE
jgi:hypothetical protein